MKFYHAKAKLVVGLDLDTYELESTTDGPKSRYKTLKNKFPNFPPMFFGIEMQVDYLIFKIKIKYLIIYQKIIKIY